MVRSLTAPYFFDLLIYARGEPSAEKSQLQQLVDQHEQPQEQDQETSHPDHASQQVQSKTRKEPGSPYYNQDNYDTQYRLIPDQDQE